MDSCIERVYLFENTMVRGSQYMKSRGGTGFVRGEEAEGVEPGA